MALENVLADIPGLSGYLAQKQYDQRHQLGGISSALGVLNALQRQQEFQQRAQMQPLEMQLMQAKAQEAQRRTADAEQQRQQLETALSSLPPEQQALARLNPQAFVSNLFKQDEGKVVGPGAALVQGGRAVYTNPATERDTRHPIEKLLDAAGIKDPAQRAQYLAQAINKQTTHQAPVNVFSTNMVPGVDAQGNPVFAQPSGRPGVAPQIVPNVFPAPKPAANKADQQARTTMGDYQAADDLITGMIRSIQGGNRIGMVGLPGKAAQVVETVQGTMDANAPSPAIDLRAQKEELIDKMRALATRKDSNFSNKDAERYENMLGFDKALVTPGATVRALTNLQQDLRRRRMNIDVRPKERGLPAQADIDAELKKRGLVE